jgi:MFS family permease
MSYWRFIKQDWPLLSFGFLMAAISGPGQTFFVGLFRDSITQAFDISIGDFGLIFSTATLISAGLFFWTGKFIDRWTVQRTTIVFSVLFGLAAALLGLAPHVAVLALGIFGIRHLGQALMGHISSTTMARYFVNNRAKAASLAAMGYSVSEAVFPISVVFLLAAMGWRFSWFVISLGIVGVFLPLALTFLRASKRDLSLDIEMGESAETTSNQTAAAQPEDQADLERQRQFTRMDVLKDRRIYMLFPVMMAGPYILTGFFFHQASLASERGLGIGVVAGFFTAFALMKILGSIVFGPLVDRFGPLKPYPFPLAILALSLFILALFDSSTSVLMFYVLSGFGVGAGIPVSGALWPTLYGTKHLGAVRSMVSSVMVLATGLAPASYGYLLDGGITISQIAMGTALYSVFALIPLIAMVILEIRRTG